MVVVSKPTKAALLLLLFLLLFCFFLWLFVVVVVVHVVVAVAVDIITTVVAVVIIFSPRNLTLRERSSITSAGIPKFWTPPTVSARSAIY